MKARDLALLLLLGVIWGSAFLFIRVAVRDVPPMTLVAGRLILAAAALLVLLRATGRAFPPRAAWPILLLLGVTNNVLPFVLVSWSEERIASALAGTLNATMPLFTFLIAVSLRQERLSVGRAAGLAVGFAGAFIIVSPTLGDLASANKVAEFAVIAASASYAFSTVAARAHLRAGDPVGSAAGQLVAGALVATPLALLVDRAPHLHASAGAAMSWIALGLLCSAFAYIIFFALVQRVGATQVALVSYVIPVVATVLGWAALGEHIGYGLIAGLALIFLALAMVNGNVRGLVAHVRGRRGAPGAPALRR
ncbi:MAG: EamA family transporter [Chloroflexota bacterium]|nr:EamA family transporter [Chloroflexota bacterium]